MILYRKVAAILFSPWQIKIKILLLNDINNLTLFRRDEKNVQGCSHAFDIGGAQASKIILGPFCLKY